MKNRDLPPRATLVVVLLALAATIVTGREPPEAAGTAASRPPQQAQAAEEMPPVQIAARKRNEERALDLFAAPSWTPLAPPPPKPSPRAVPPEPPPVVEPPSAPPLPFRYLGQLGRQNRTLVFLLRGDDVLIVGAGDAVDNTYKVEAIAESAIEFTYLPLGTKQSLAIPAAP